MADDMFSPELTPSPTPTETGIPEQKRSDESMIEALLEELKSQDDSLEGQLELEFPYTDSEYSSRTLLVFRHSLPDGAAGVSSSDGPVIISRRLRDELFDANKKQSVAAAGRRIKNNYDEDMVGQIRIVSDESMMAAWQGSYAENLELAQKRAKEIRGRRDVLPKLLDFVREKSKPVETPTQT